MINDKTTRRASRASALPFEFAAALALDAGITCLKKMTVTESPSSIAFFRIDADTQRFYISSRAFRSHLIEAQGLLTRVDEGHTKVTGEVFGTVRSTLLTALLAGVGFVFVVAVTFSLWALLADAVLGIAAALYWLLLSEQVESDKAELVRLFEEALGTSGG